MVFDDDIKKTKDKPAISSRTKKDYSSESDSDADKKLKNGKNTDFSSFYMVRLR